MEELQLYFVPGWLQPGNGDVKVAKVGVVQICSIPQMYDESWLQKKPYRMFVQSVVNIKVFVSFYYNLLLLFTVLI